MATKSCGAKTRAGTPCKGFAMKNGRCRMHGGRSTGAPGNRNAIKPGGLYSRYMTPEEQQIADALKLGSLEDEIRLTRIRLLRVLELERQADECDGDDDALLEIEGKTVEPVMLGGMPDDEDVVERRSYRRRDYPALVDRLTARIAGLEAQHAQLASMAASTRRQQIELADIEKGKQAGGMVQNVIIVPACSNVDDWEAVSRVQQEGLLNEH
ncbi:hypothetical protein V8N76_004572 [Salmonella enterica]